VRIAELARQMIQLSGFSVRDASHPQGEIALEFTGLRPGEKLFEELLISANDSPTDHELIRQAREATMPTVQLHELISELLQLIHVRDEAGVRDLLVRIVPEYKVDSRLVSMGSRVTLRSDDSSVA
jgi:FlaA1/EpsC-like NDP-sugar epimerase